MEKVIWVNSRVSQQIKGLSIVDKVSDGLDVVNQYLEDGWKVKLISACSRPDTVYDSLAYIVIEKDG